VDSDFNDVTAIELRRGRTVRLTFESGDVRDVDLTPFLWGPAFAQIADSDERFAQVTVDPEIGTIVWPNGADLAPQALYRHSEPVHAEAS
jgi:hypothetical protein